ncbi:hypothetical protein WJX75_008056 [Coccomyxa subellipsoidea]|uniref:Uncharacterized protein n=1 Tax=Coccomyxa subellipsoidea TaxID=248742 RepID=A0ABR2YWK6_9CHLO
MFIFYLKVCGLELSGLLGSLSSGAISDSLDITTTAQRGMWACAFRCRQCWCAAGKTSTDVWLECNTYGIDWCLWHYSSADGPHDASRQFLSEEAKVELKIT